MAIYLISYDLHQPGQNYEELYLKIKSLGPWAHALLSEWAVETNLSAKAIFNTLWPLLDKSDDLLVTELKGQWWGNIDSDNIDWFKQRLP